MLPEKKYIRAVVKGCKEQGVHVSEELATVFYKNYTLNLHTSQHLQKKPSVSYSNERIVDQCINRLLVCKDPVILSIKMQLLLEHDYKNREFIINKVNEENDQKIRPLVNAILDDVYTSGDENSIQYQRLIQYIILINYMGDPTSSICIQETSSALNKVLNQNKLIEFENQLPSSKKKQLKEIANLVCGILNTTDQRACKEKIFDIIDTLPNAVELLLQNITQELEFSSKKITAIVSWICQCYKMDSDFLAPLFVIRTHLATIRYDELNEYKTVLVFYSQYKKNLKAIKKDLSKCQIDLSGLVNNYNLKLKEIRHYLKDSNRFDEIIHPQLIEVSIIWNEMIEITNYLSVTTNLIVTMKLMAKEVNINVENYTETSLTIFQTINEEEQHKIIETYPLHPMCQWYPPSANRTNLFADGYCVVMIVETSGTLIKHDKTLSIIQYSDEWFGFSCIQAALHFGTKPSYYLNCFYNLVKSQVHLLFFFHLYDKLTERQYTKNELTRDKYNSNKYKNYDAQVQTSLHPFDTNTIKEYSQNTQKIKLSSEHLNIPNMSTQSAQTIDAYKSILVQTAPRDVGCNTMSEKGTNTDQLESYLTTHYKYKPCIAFKNDVNK